MGNIHSDTHIWIAALSRESRAVLSISAGALSLADESWSWSEWATSTLQWDQSERLSAAYEGIQWGDTLHELRIRRGEITGVV